MGSLLFSHNSIVYPKRPILTIKAPTSASLGLFGCRLLGFRGIWAWGLGFRDDVSERDKSESQIVQVTREIYMGLGVYMCWGAAPRVCSEHPGRSQQDVGSLVGFLKS